MTKLPMALAAALLEILALSARAATPYIDVQYRQDHGIRPFIPISMNGKSFLMMVHSGAGFYMMTTHKNAATIGLDKLRQTDSYGISVIGHVSLLGFVDKGFDV
jgi:hypothetical protein